MDTSNEIGFFWVILAVRNPATHSAYNSTIPSVTRHYRHPHLSTPSSFEGLFLVMAATVNGVGSKREVGVENMYSTADSILYSTDDTLRHLKVPLTKNILSP